VREVLVLALAADMPEDAGSGSPTLAIGLRINPYEYRCQTAATNPSWRGRVNRLPFLIGVRSTADPPCLGKEVSSSTRRPHL